MAIDPEQTDQPINQFAVVTYIPGRLGDFLNRLREELVPKSTALAHVTVLPPRSIEVPCGEAADYISTQITDVFEFQIGMAEVQVFDKTEVVYAEIGIGRESLLDLHYHLNRQGLSFTEQFPYHPHVTLAQNFDHAPMSELYEVACRRWEEYQHERSFLLDRVTFVQNTEQNNWTDLAWYRLRSEAEKGRR